MEFYREKIEMLGLEFRPMRPHIDFEEAKEMMPDLMDAKKGPEKMLREIVLPNLREMYDDLTEAVGDADLFITGEVVYVAPSVAEKTGKKWISSGLSPVTTFSATDPGVFPTAQWLRHLRPLGAGFHRTLFSVLRLTIRQWFAPLKKFRREIGLDENHNPVFDDKYSDLLHLALFSKALAKPQADWHQPTLQTGFCFYDGQSDTGVMPAGLAEFLDAGDAPVVFTLGSAAVMDARDFFEESAKAAQMLGRRAVLLYGVYNEPPKLAESGEWRVESGKNIKSNIAAFDYAPYSLIFPKAACVVHQGGVGTTAQVLRAGVPHLVMPYSHDQPDNAARCERIGVARVISRDDYTAENAARYLREILTNSSYQAKALEASVIVAAESGTQTACDAIEEILRK
jgi:UDP:flavonoid glycosyltransferase YjiC (YdhE family)